MKNILKIFNRDLKKIFTNWVALVVILGLMCLPAIYAWPNILASWDPYGNTQGIKVAIVNNDSGHNLKDKQINVGDELIKQLKENDKLGWQFVDEEEGDKGVENGKYYATIIIPQDFSKETLSIVSNDVEKPKLIYKVNQKVNAIAPKITDKGVSSIKSQLDSKIIETVDGVIFKVLNETGIEVEGVKPTLMKFVNGVININDRMPEIENLINSAYEGTITAQEVVDKVKENIPVVKETLEMSKGLLGDTKIALQNSKKGLEEVAPIVKKDLEVVNSTLTSLESTVDDLSKVDIDKDKVINVLDKISSKVMGVKEDNNSILGLLKPLEKLNPKIKNIVAKLEQINIKLDKVANFIGKIKADIEEGKPVNKEDLVEFKKLIADNNVIVANVLKNYDSEYVPEINSAIGKMTEISDNALKIVGEAQGTMPKVDDLLDKLDSGVNLGKDELAKLKEDMPSIKEKISKVANKLKGLNDEEQIDTALDLLKNDWEKTSSFLASPVEIEENVLFPIPTYGSAMSPFYSTLSLWVGALILVSILTVDARKFDEDKELKAYEKYFGKFLTFAFIGLFQALIVSVGDILLLNCYVVDPIKFVAVSVFSSMIFMSIVYTLTSVFGNIGKAIAIILLVIQVAGAGGTFPIEVTTSFFQKVNPFLPFTYAISAMRECVGGVVPEILARDIVVLYVYAIIAIIIGILLKKPINKSSKKFIDKLKESDLVGH